MAEQKDPHWLYRWFGYASGNAYRIKREWQNEKDYVRKPFYQEVEYLSGDIETPFKGAAKGLIDGAKEYAKVNPIDTAEAAKEVANILDITPGNPKLLAFLDGFATSAKSK